MTYKEDMSFKKLRLTLSKTLTGCLIKQPTTKKKVAVINLKTWLSFQGPS